MFFHTKISLSLRETFLQNKLTPKRNIVKEDTDGDVSGVYHLIEKIFFLIITWKKWSNPYKDKRKKLCMWMVDIFYIEVYLMCLMMA